MIRPTLTTLALAVFVAAPTVSAQVVQDVPITVSDVRVDERLRPAAPVVSPALQARVHALRRIAEKTSECYSSGERVEHTADPRCGRWYAALRQGGVAGVIAMGEALTANEAEVEGHEILRNSEGQYETGPRLVQVLAATRHPEAVTYMVRYLVDSLTLHGEEFGSVDEEIFRQLPRIAGYDVYPVGPWDSEALTQVEVRRAAVTAWSEWLRNHREQTRAQWLAEGETRSLNDLTSDNPAVRFAALRRLATMSGHAAAVIGSVREILAREDLVAVARVEIRRWATRTHIAVPARTQARL
jgi:hypothetical protein